MNADGSEWGDTELMKLRSAHANLWRDMQRHETVLPNLRRHAQECPSLAPLRVGDDGVD